MDEAASIQKLRLSPFQKLYIATRKPSEDWRVLQSTDMSFQIIQYDHELVSALDCWTLMDLLFVN